MKLPRDNTPRKTYHRHASGLKGKDPRPTRFDLQKKAWEAEQGLADEDLEHAIDLAMYFGSGE